MATDTRRSAHPIGAPTLAIEPRRPRPVLWWAGLGVGFAAIATWSMGTWLLSGPESTPVGKTPVPGYMWWSIRIQEALGPVVLVIMLYYVVFKPWRRDHRLSWDGVLFLACLGIVWQDPLAHYFNYWAVYSSVLINWGSWASHIPGWIAPNGAKYVESPLWGFTWYAYGFFGVIVLGNWVMRRAKARWPRIGGLGLFGVCFVFMIGLDVLLELTYARLGIYTFVSVIKPLTIFKGHFYQFPLYEGLTFGALWAGMSSVRYFRDDKGESVFERGLDQVRAIGPKTRTILRFFALFAILNLLFLGWNLIQQPLIIHGSGWNHDQLKRSYFTEELCGPGTTYACPSPEVPFPRGENSVHVGPNGELVVPKGTKVPSPVEATTSR